MDLFRSVVLAVAVMARDSGGVDVWRDSVPDLPPLDNESLEGKRPSRGTCRGALLRRSR